MFSTLHTSARAVLLAALVGGAALVAPTVAAAQSVTPEQALLNRHQAAPSEAQIAVGQGHARPAPVAPAAIDGERALLNHSQATAEAPVEAVVRGESAVGAVQYPSGVKALLNRSGF